MEQAHLNKVQQRGRGEGFQSEYGRNSAEIITVIPSFFAVIITHSLATFFTHHIKREGTLLYMFLFLLCCWEYLFGLSLGAKGGGEREVSALLLELVGWVRASFSSFLLWAFAVCISVVAGMEWKNEEGETSINLGGEMGTTKMVSLYVDF